MLNALRYTVVLFTSWWFPALVAPALAADPIEVESVVLRLLEEAEVPAQEAGIVTQIAVREGQRVARGELLVQIDDEVARLASAAAELQYNVAAAKATNDVRLRFARKALEVSEAELKRSTESVERFAKSVSQSQLDVERLTVEKNRLELEQAMHENEVAQLEMKVKDHERTAAQSAVNRRRVAAPFDGIVVQALVRQGEWVEPGRQALRVVNVERLKAEGFLPASRASSALAGATVTLTLSDQKVIDAPQSFDGKIVFVSPEVDPITNQVRVWAEIDNRAGHLRPGQAVKMTVAKQLTTNN
jgi:macrolide-specific efflux system membrane fusion protein